jgi:mxaJ protein
MPRLVQTPLAATIALCAAAIAISAPALAADVRVCADPDNLPFSNEAQQGFENKLAGLVANELGEHLSYVWARQGPGFIDTTLNAGLCDVVMGIPSEFTRVATTRPYYWSSYVFVSRRDRGYDIDSAKDKQLRSLTVGLEQVSDDRFATPPARALADSGLAQNLKFFPVDIGNPGKRLIAALVHGDIDIAAIWGPRGGYFARQSAVPLQIVPIGDTDEFSTRKDKFELMSFQYDISMGVRRGDEMRRAALDAVIARKAPEIRAILSDYGVPLIEPGEAAGGRQAAAE